LKKGIIKVVMTLLLMYISFSLVPFVAHSSPTTTFYVDPSSIIDQNLAPGSSFTVSVNVADAVDLFAWQVYMSWNTALLNATEIIFGDFLAGQPEGTTQVSHIKNAEGYMVVGESTIGTYTGLNGNGWLFSATFLIGTIGETVLDINSELTYYIDSLHNILGDDPGEIIKENGYFNNSGAVIPATLQISPDLLTLSRKGGFITAYIELPGSYNVNDIDISTVKLNGEVQARLRPAKVGDYDKNGIPDLMVKFVKKEVIPLLSAGENTLIIAGVVSGEIFEGFDTITAV
jgi:hypothetical protein